PTPQTYPLSLHDALPIYEYPSAVAANRVSAVIELNPSATDRTNRAMPYSVRAMTTLMPSRNPVPVITGKIISKGIDGMANNSPRSEEHTSELQSRFDLVC